MPAKFTLHTQTGRARLAPAVNPYWHRLSKGRFVGLHVAEGGCMYWRARMYVEATQSYLYEPLGQCVDGSYEFDQAVAAAEAWFVNEQARLNGGRVRKGAYTVAQALLDQITRKLADKKPDDPRRDDLRHLFERIVLGSPEGEARKVRYERDPLADLEMNEKQLTANAINGWLGRQKARVNSKGERRKNSSINQDYKALRSALNAAVELRECASDVRLAWECNLNALLPTGKHSGGGAASSNSRSYLKHEQVQAWVQRLDVEVARDLLRAQYYLGCRPGKELNQMLVQDFNAERREVTIRHGKTQVRTIGLTPAAFALFARLAGNRGPREFLFTQPDGAPINTYTYRDLFRETAVEAGLPAGTCPYSLRHSFITNGLTDPQISPTELAAHCGTSVEQFRKHYFHLMTRSLAARLQSIQDAHAPL